MNIEAW
jgi:hypothetical protein